MQLGVIGAGIMGGGIAQVFALAQNTEVLLCDVSLLLAQQGQAKILERLAKSVKKGSISAQQQEKAAANIRACTLEELAGCDLIIEAIKEDLGLKKDLFAQLDSLCKPNCVFASNTSALSLAEISHGLGRPVIGLHFFNPVPAMKLVEVIVTQDVPEEMLGYARACVEAIGKVPVTIQNSPGFVVNRLLLPMINEAIAIFAEGVASAEEIDIAMKLGANHPVGPLALGDLIGLDICLAILQVLCRDLHSDKYKPHPLLVSMVASGLLGRKSGKGFYSYQ